MICMLDNQHKNSGTLIIFNTYCFSMATMVMQMHSSVILYVHCLSHLELPTLVLSYTKIAFTFILSFTWTHSSKSFNFKIKVYGKK